jgi:hypothetical protein
MSIEALRTPGHAQGSVVLLMLVALVTLVGIVGLAVDASHLGYVKSRLQSTADAMSLAAARRLDETGSTLAACETARDVMLANAVDFTELSDELPVGISCPENTWFQLQFSATPTPFVPGSTPARYVRVRLADVSSNVSFARVLGIANLSAGASAIAGPSAPLIYACNVVPLAACADLAIGKPYFGYVPKGIYGLRDDGGTTVGSFNFLSLGDNGASALRTNLAGDYATCLAVGDPVDTKPGQSTGPVSEGFNTRFVDGKLPAAAYPPDVVVDEPSPALAVNVKTGQVTQGSRVITQASDLEVNHAKYEADIADGLYDNQPPPVGLGAFRRRDIAVPLVNCKAPTKGRTSLPILGFGCFFLLQKVDRGGSTSEIFVEFIQDCEAGGRPGPNPGTGGPYVIQLFRDSSSRDS